MGMNRGIRDTLNMLFCMRLRCFRVCTRSIGILPFRGTTKETTAKMEEERTRTKKMGERLDRAKGWSDTASQFPNKSLPARNDAHGSPNLIAATQQEVTPSTTTAPK